MSNNKFKILVIEDETNICSFLETLLIANGYQTMTAKNCVTGNSLFMSYNPDLVILDLGLPDKDGIEFIKSIRKTFTTPIIVLSGQNFRNRQSNRFGFRSKRLYDKAIRNGRTYCPYTSDSA